LHSSPLPPKIRYQFRAVLAIIFRLPSVFLIPVSLPLDQVVTFLAASFFVSEDFLYFIFFVTVD
jgi:hypothetical protein